MGLFLLGLGTNHGDFGSHIPFLLHSLFLYLPVCNSFKNVEALSPNFKVKQELRPTGAITYTNYSSPSASASPTLAEH